jgi:hypothetical protein
MTSGRVERICQDYINLMTSTAIGWSTFQATPYGSWRVVEQSGMRREDWKSINIFDVELFATISARLPINFRMRQEARKPLTER